MKRSALLALVVSVSFTIASSGARAGAAAQTSQNAGELSPAVLAQIDALIAEKESRSATDRKVDSQLLYELKMETGQPVAAGVFAIATDLPYAADGHIVADVHARAGSGLGGRLTAAGFEILSESADGSSIRLHLNIDQVQVLAADSDVLFVQPRQDATVGQQATPNAVLSETQTGVGSRSSEGDITHLAYAARTAFGVNGTGVRVGVLSDGVRNLAASVARGDLPSAPNAVTVLGPASPCPAANTCDEGTAMLEIIHDLAPGARLYFASAFVSLTQFAQNIRDLRDCSTATSPCVDILVDDVFYFVETPFQDGAPGATNTNGGAVIQAVNDVTTSGALYFSSAGNSGNLNDGTSGVWEGDFADGGPTAAPLAAGNRLHNFGGSNFNVITAASTGPVGLYWADPLGGSTNDYDLFILNPAGTAVAAASTNVQNGSQDPYEQTGQAAGFRVVVVKSAAAAGRFLHVNTNRGRLSIATAGQTHGHNSAANGYGVAATPAVGPFPSPFNASNAVENFSSDGPRRIFFQANGTPYTAGNFSSTGGLVRQKPDITAADGVAVTGVGGFSTPFFGTSAAAPHAAAIAALLKSANPALTPAQVRSALLASAIDIEGAGTDRDSGAGIIMANRALAAAGVAGTGFVDIDGFEVSENPGDGDGVPEAGEGVRLSIRLGNYGPTPVTGINATLTTSSPYVLITQPGLRAYGNLNAFALSVGPSAYLFTAASDFPCPAAAPLTLTLTDTGDAGPKVFHFDVPIGHTTFTTTKALNGLPPASGPNLVGATGVQGFRLNRQDSASVCGALKPPPPISSAGGPGNRQFDAYTFTTCPVSVPSCASVTFSGPNSINMFTAAYVPTFNPADITQNYRADPAVSSGGALTYSFNLPAGSSTFAIDVHDVPVLAAPSNSPYTLTVSGACMGACDPPNHVPVAQARAVTASANNVCVANASVDDGSSDADGDPLTLVQTPGNPYPLGLTSPVLLTVTDPKGAASQANGSVAVVDDTAPSIACPAPISVNSAPGACSAIVSFALPTAADNCSVGSISTHPVSGSTFPVGTTNVTGTAVDGSGNPATCTLPITVVDNESPSMSVVAPSPAVLWPPNHQMIDVVLNYTVADNCGSSSCVVSITSNEPNDGEDWQIVDAHHVRLRAEREGSGRGRIYTITVTCTDAAGNPTVRSATVLAPHDQR